MQPNEIIARLHQLPAHAEEDFEKLRLAVATAPAVSNFPLSIEEHRRSALLASSLLIFPIKRDSRLIEVLPGRGLNNIWPLLAWFTS